MDVNAPFDQRFFFRRIKIGKQGILRVRMRRDLVARLDGLLRSRWCEFERAGIGNEGARYLVLVQNFDEPPDSRAPAVSAPGHRRAVMSAWSQRRRLH